MLVLTSPYFQFTINPETGSWSLYGSQQNAPFIEDAWMQVNYRHKNKLFYAMHSWHDVEIIGPGEITSQHGNMYYITLALGPDINGLHFKIDFALPKSHPLFLWRLTIENIGNSPVEIERIQMLQAGTMPTQKRLPFLGIRSKRNQKNNQKSGVIRPHPDPGELAFFSNGWQSWSYTGSYGSNERYRDTRLGFLTTPMWFNNDTPRPHKPGHFASDMFGILGDRQHRSGILAGFLSQKKHFGSLEANTNPLYPALALWANGDRARLDPGLHMTTDWAAIQFVDIDSPDPFEPYLKAVSREHDLRISNVNQQSSIGWCSWYQFYQDISETKMRDNLNSAVEIRNNLPFDLFQIDDGFESQIGDWFNFSPGFPNGVAPLAREIEEAGFTPGLWLAPFIVHSKSQIKRRHPDWLLHNRLGQPVNAGFVWNNFNTALDLTHPEALDYVRDVIHTATHEWGYQFLKLDFLYAAAIKGRYCDRSQTRAQVLRMGLEAIQEAAGPQIQLLGCSVPLGPSIGIFGSMRIGPDVDPRWRPSFLGFEFPFKNEYPMPSTRNAIQNTLTRSQLHNRWWVNDPDCLLVRPDSDLSLAEVQLLATVIALTGGTLLLSDDLPQLPAERLHIAKQLVPLIGKRPHILDWFDTASPNLLSQDLENVSGKWKLLAVLNWFDTNWNKSILLEKLGLPEGKYFAREFWTDAISQTSEGILTFDQIPAHGVRLVALRPAQLDQACYLGGNFHISQGLEITQWSESSLSLNFQIEKPGNNQGQIDLYLPQPPTMITANQKAIKWQALDKDIYRLHTQFEQTAEVQIN